jgi:hypothetical protein
VKEGKQHLVSQGSSGVVPRLWKDMNEVLETGWNHPGRVPKPDEPNCIFHVLCPLLKSLYSTTLA